MENLTEEQMLERISKLDTIINSFQTHVKMLSSERSKLRKLHNEKTCPFKFTLVYSPWGSYKEKKPKWVRAKNFRSVGDANQWLQKEFYTFLNARMSTYILVPLFGGRFQVGVHDKEIAMEHNYYEMDIEIARDLKTAQKSNMMWSTIHLDMLRQSHGEFVNVFSMPTYVWTPPQTG